MFVLKDSKLIEILRTLTPDEFKDLEKFIGSPFFAVGRDLTPFLKVLKTFYPSFESENLNYEYIFAKLYPDKKDTGKIQQTMKTLSSDLIRSCKEFLKQIEFKKDVNRGNYYLLNQMRIRKLYRDFAKEYETSLKFQTETDTGGITDFIKRYFLSAVFRDYSLDNDNFVNSYEYTLATDENIIVGALMGSLMIEDLKAIASGYNLPVRYNLLENLQKHLDMEGLISEMKKNNDRFYPYVLIHYMIYKMYKIPEGNRYYYELKELLVRFKDLFGQSENYTFWNITNSYCNIHMVGDHKESLWLYKYIVENNVYRKSLKEDFHIIMFRNIVITSAEAGETEWLEKFIPKYIGELHVDHRDNMNNFSNAYLNFAKNKFDTSLGYMSKINPDLFIFRIDVRVLLMKLHFELSYFEQAFSLIDSTMHYLKNTNDLAEINKDRFRAFIKFYKDLLKIKSSGKPDKQTLNFLRDKLISIDFMVQKEWFLDKLNQIINE